MDEKVLATLSPENKAKMAVAYLTRHRDEVPEELQRFFDKLQQYEDSMKDVIMSLREAEASMNELMGTQEQLKGSISAVVDLVSAELNEELVSKACAAYEMPAISPQMTGAAQGLMQAGPTSMAGATAQMQPPPQIVRPDGAPVPTVPAQ